MTAGSPPSGPRDGLARAVAAHRFGDYQIVEKVEQGGMADIFLAKRIGLAGFEKNVVIKRMLESLSSVPEFVEMFLNEARTAAKLDHPNIAQLSDFGAIEGWYYIAMEYVAGEDARRVVWHSRQRQTKIPVGIALRIVLSVAEALEYAHTLTEGGVPLEIVHRDVSPANIMVSYNGVVKLLDFGIVKTAARIGNTRSGTVKGKLAFASPEQVRGEPVDARVDLWSLGLTLFELLTNERWFQRDSEAAVLNAILHEPPPRPESLRSDIPPEVAAIVRKAVERDRTKRYQSAAAMRADLEQCLGKVAPPVGNREVGQFMLSLFGEERMKQRTDVPSTRSSETEAAELAPAADMPTFGVPQPIVTGGASEAYADVHVSGRQGRRPRVVTGALVLAACVLFGLGGLALLRSPATSGVSGVIAPAPNPSAPPPLPAVDPSSALPAVSAVTALPRPVIEGPADSPAAEATPAPSLEAAPIAAAASVPKIPARPRQPLTTGAVARVIERAHAKILRCFDREKQSLTSREGEITLALSVARSGTVEEVEVISSGLASPALAACVVERVKTLRFPSHADKLVRVKVPFVYRVRN